MAFSENLKFNTEKPLFTCNTYLKKNLATNVKSMGTLKNICAVLKKAMMHFFNLWHQAASQTSYFSENNLRIIFSLENHI